MIDLDALPPLARENYTRELLLWGGNTMAGAMLITCVMRVGVPEPEVVPYLKRLFADEPELLAIDWGAAWRVVRARDALAALRAHNAEAH